LTITDSEPGPSGQSTGPSDPAGEPGAGVRGPGLHGGTAGPAVPSPRVTVHAVSVVSSGGHCSAQVHLRQGDEQSMAVAEGVMAVSVARRLVAEATLTALALLDDEARGLALDAVAIAAVSDHQVAIATVVLPTPPYEELLAGAALVRGAGEHDAIARAVLDAGNRRLSGRWPAVNDPPGNHR